MLDLMADGLSNIEIADQLRISESTIKNHVSHILGKLEARDRTHAVRLAWNGACCMTDKQDIVVTPFAEKEMRLRFYPTSVHLTVSNAFCGAHNKSAKDDSLQGSGTGLCSLADRVHAQGGRFTAGENADGDFIVAIELPVA